MFERVYRENGLCRDSRGSWTQPRHPPAISAKPRLGWTKRGAASWTRASQRFKYNFAERSDRLSQSSIVVFPILRGCKAARCSRHVLTCPPDGLGARLNEADEGAGGRTRAAAGRRERDFPSAFHSHVQRRLGERHTVRSHPLTPTHSVSSDFELFKKGRIKKWRETREQTRALVACAWLKISLVHCPKKLFENWRTLFSEETPCGSGGDRAWIYSHKTLI